MVPKTIQERKRPPHLVRIPRTPQIKAILAEHSLSVTEFAKLLKVNKYHLSAVISGKQRVGPNSPLARHISEYLNQPVDRLFPVIDLNQATKSAAA